MRALNAWSFAIAIAWSVGSFGADFVGPEGCRACHAEAYQIWKASKHARAADSMGAAHQKDAQCVSCHSPDLNQRQAHVTCETCHGGGRHYAASYVMKDAELSRLVGLVDPDEKSCRTCHDASSPSLLPFDFVEKLNLIDHWSHARAKKQAALDAAGGSEVKKK
jgi:hypothetical protein